MNAGLIAKLVEAGTPAELVGEVAMALAHAAAASEALDNRRKSDRERQAARRNVTSRDTADVTADPTPLCPPLKVSPDPFKKTPPISPRPTTEARARRLPDDWVPEPLTGKALEMVRHWQPGEQERELAKFKNYWLGKGGKDACKTDWQRTWINWLIAADERKPRNGRPHEPTSRNTAAFELAMRGVDPFAPM